MLKRVRQTKEDRSWKGHIGRIGDEYIIVGKEMSSPYAPGQFRVWGNAHCTIQQDFFEHIPMGCKGYWLIIRDLPKEYRWWRWNRSFRAALQKSESGRRIRR